LPGTGSAIDGEAQGFKLQGFELLEPSDFEDAARRCGTQLPDSGRAIAVRVLFPANRNVPVRALH
jgi:hypothetical protein